MSNTCKYILSDLNLNNKTDQFIKDFIIELQRQQEVIKDLKYATDKYQCFHDAMEQAINQKVYCHINVKDMDFSIPFAEKSSLTELNRYQQSINYAFNHLNECAQHFTEDSLFDERIIGELKSYYDDKCDD